jgi:hypothetical protein
MSKPSVALITLLFALCSLLAPISAANAGGGGLDIKDVPHGSLIASWATPAIYYYAYDGKRYVFPNEKVYFSWFKDFTGVKRVGSKSLATVSIGGNVTYKPGARLVKIQTDPKVYAVANNKILRWVTTEALARELYGAGWATEIHDVPDAFFIDYNIGRPITSAEQYDPAWDIYARQTPYNITLHQGDPSELPADMPFYSGGSVTSVSVYDEDGEEGSVFMQSDADPESVIAWYREHAPKDGWTLAEKTLVEQKMEELGTSERARFRKQDRGTAYELSVSCSGSDIYVLRTQPEPEPDVSSFPSFVPVYDKGEIVGAEAVDEGLLAYMALTEESLRDASAYMEGRLQSESWREINRADADHGMARLYDRPFGNEVKNLFLAIISFPDTQDLSYVVVMYGQPEQLSEVAAFDEIAEALKEF